MDAISLLKKDHRTVESLFKQFEKLGDGAAKEKKALAQQITRELSIHAAIEEEILYPAARSVMSGDDDIVLESLEEHRVVKWLLSEISGMSPTAERFDAKVTVLRDSVMHHVEEEENELFPKLQKKLDKQTLDALGKALESAKKMAPTRPHPRAPDTPPGNLIAGLPAAMLDKIKDLVSGVAQRGQSMRGTNGARTGRNAPKRTSATTTSRSRKTMSGRAASPRIGRASSSSRGR